MAWTGRRNFYTGNFVNIRTFNLLLPDRPNDVLVENQRENQNRTGYETSSCGCFISCQTAALRPVPVHGAQARVQ